MSRSLSEFVAGISLTGARFRSAAHGFWASLMPGPAERYRPEAHYMRGPGPKWRAKHVQISSRTTSSRLEMGNNAAGVGA
jgi:hypothetical protein